MYNKSKLTKMGVTRVDVPPRDTDSGDARGWPFRCYRERCAWSGCDIVDIRVVVVIWVVQLLNE